MPDLIYLLAVLACPIVMGVMMLVMMRSGDHQTQPSISPQADEVAQLRWEVERLRAAQERSSDAGDRPGASSPSAG